MKEKVSVIIITYNEEKNIARCLESVRWADEIIIVDSFSKDKTLKIAKRYNNKIFQREWTGYSEQRNFGLLQATNEWVLFIDADESISSLLADEIKVALQGGGELDGYYLLRQSFYLGRKIEHGEWNPDWKLRLVKKEKAKWVGPRVHEKLSLSGRRGYLEGPLYHFTYRNIGHHLKKVNLYSSLFAEDAAERGEVVSLRELTLRPLARFKDGYCVKEGFKDGWPGLVIAALQSWEVFLRYVKLSFLNFSGIIIKSK
jgi:glycosyltransferase involved in cell wall biosynthesis